MDQPDSLRLQLKGDDGEGEMIQAQGVNAIVYSAKLWSDKTVLHAIMRERNDLCPQQ